MTTRLRTLVVAVLLAVAALGSPGYGAATLFYQATVSATTNNTTNSFTDNVTGGTSVVFPADVVLFVNNIASSNAVCVRVGGATSTCAGDHEVQPGESLKFTFKGLGSGWTAYAMRTAAGTATVRVTAMRYQ